MSLNCTQFWKLVVRLTPLSYKRNLYSVLSNNTEISTKILMYSPFLRWPFRIQHVSGPANEPWSIECRTGNHCCLDRGWPWQPNQDFCVTRWNIHRWSVLHRYFCLQCKLWWKLQNLQPHTAIEQEQSLKLQTWNITRKGQLLRLSDIDNGYWYGYWIIPLLCDVK